MSTEIKKEIELQIAHVLFIDIVGYSKLSINDQHAAIEELNRIVRAAEQFQRAEAASRLLKIPTGDGMALVFYMSPEAPALRCGDQPRTQGTSRPATSDGNPQRTSQRGCRCKRAGESRRYWDQYGAAGDGLR